MFPVDVALKLSRFKNNFSHQFFGAWWKENVSLILMFLLILSTHGWPLKTYSTSFKVFTLQLLPSFSSKSLVILIKKLFIIVPSCFCLRQHCLFLKEKFIWI